MIALTFLCAACLVESVDAFCEICGHQLTAADLTTANEGPPRPLPGRTATGQTKGA